MDRSFFKSKEFGIALAICAVVLVAGTVAAMSWGIGSTDWRYEVNEACAPREAEGELVAVAPVQEMHTRGPTAWRIVTYELNASDLAGGVVDLCSDVGHIKVVPSPDPVARLVFTIESSGLGAVEAVNLTDVEALFARSDAGLAIAGWQATHVHVGRIFRDNGAEVRIELQLPETGAYDVKAVSGVGFVAVDGLLVRELDVTANVGDVSVTDVDLVGNASMVTEVGSIDARFASFQTALVTATAEVGDVDILLPRRMDVGYDVQATGDVADVEIDIGETESSTHEEEGAYESASARSSGYSSKLVNVRVQVETDVGDIRIIASES